jgi:hypothetical protein
MVSRLPLWQHGYGELAHPTPGSCFGRVCSRVGLKVLALFYCMAEKKINYQTQLFILVFISLPTSNAPKIMVSCFPPCLPTCAHPLHTPLRCGRLFLVGYCVSRCQSLAVQRQRISFFLFFCPSIFHPQTIIRHPPHTFRRNRISSMMIPSQLTPTFG